MLVLNLSSSQLQIITHYLCANFFSNSTENIPYEVPDPFNTLFQLL